MGIVNLFQVLGSSTESQLVFKNILKDNRIHFLLSGLLYLMLAFVFFLVSNSLFNL